MQTPTILNPSTRQPLTGLLCRGTRPTTIPAESVLFTKSKTSPSHKTVALQSKGSGSSAAQSLPDQLRCTTPATTVRHVHTHACTHSHHCFPLVHTPPRITREISGGRVGRFPGKFLLLLPTSALLDPDCTSSPRSRLFARADTILERLMNGIQACCHGKRGARSPVSILARKYTAHT